MTERELMEGLSHIDDDLVEEAADSRLISKEDKEADDNAVTGNVPENRHEPEKNSKPETSDNSESDPESRPASVTEIHKKQRRVFRIPASWAAVFCLVILGGGALAGGMILSQRNQIADLQNQMSSAEQENAAEDSDGAAGNAGDSAENSPAAGTGDGSLQTVGIGGTDIAGTYSVAGSYQELYEQLKAMNAVYDDSPEYEYYDNEVVEEAAAEDSSGSSTSAAAASDDMTDVIESIGGYSTTNVMTEGVDESDIIKTDGNYIYMVQSGSVKITDIRNGKPGDSKSLTISFLSPSDTIEELYVDDGSMIIISSHAEKVTDAAYTAWYGENEYRDQTCAYVYDISDPQNPELRGSMVQDGSYHTSRKVGDIVYLFTDQRMLIPSTDKASKTEVTADEKLSLWVPTVNGVPVAADCIWVPDNGYYSTVVSSFRVDAPDQTLDAKVIMNDYSEIYVSASRIYLYQQVWMEEREITEITSFGYSDGMITAGAENTVNGYIPDKFAIHEVNDHLVVLTTDYSGTSDVNTLFLFDDQMELTGRIDEIARGEQIYAARYIGTTAYFITYENHDPLYVADLSDPADPKILGQVEISGFSDYLHVWDETHVLGIGFETDEESNREGMKLVMFDVSDSANPVIENTITLYGSKAEAYRKTHWDNSECWYDSTGVSGTYKAVLVEPAQNLIGFAYTWYNWLNDESEQAYYTVLSYDESKGFTEELEYELDAESTRGFRGLYSGDWFYIAGEGEITAFDRTKNFAEG